MNPKEFRDDFAISKGYRDWDTFYTFVSNQNEALNEMMEEYKTGLWKA